MSDFTTYGATLQESSFRSWHAPVCDEPRHDTVDTEDEVVIDTPPDIEAMLVAEYERGKRETEEQLADEQQRLATAIASLQAAVDSVANARGDALNASAEQIGTIIHTVAHRVLDRSLALHPNALPHLIRKTVMQMPSRDEITVTLSPTAADALPKHFEDEMNVRVAVDAEACEGCVVSSPAVTIDATIHAMIDGVDEAVKDWVNSQSSLTSVSRRDAP